MTLAELQPGQIVVFAHPVDRYPFALIPAGTLGVVREVDGHRVSVRPMGHFPGLAEWSGCVEWYGPDQDDHTGIQHVGHDLRAVTVAEITGCEVVA